MDLNRNSGKEEGTPDLSPGGGEGADCRRDGARAETVTAPRHPSRPSRTHGDPASTCPRTKSLHLQPGGRQEPLERVIESIDSGARLPGSKSQLRHFLAG